MIGDTWGIRRPFEVAFFSFLLSTTYVRFALPYVSPESVSGGSKSDSKGIAAFLSPLRVMLPQKVILESGALAKHYGVLFLCAGVFLGVVSASFGPPYGVVMLSIALSPNKVDVSIVGYWIRALADPNVCYGGFWVRAKRQRLAYV